MSTRCHIYIDDIDVTVGCALPAMTTVQRVPMEAFLEQGVLLYHHADGHPDTMMPALRAWLSHAHSLVTRPPCFWWDSERVASIIVAASVGRYLTPDYDPDRKEHTYEKLADGRNGSGWGVPTMQVAEGFHPDIEWLYWVSLEGGDPFRHTGDDCRACIVTFAATTVEARGTVDLRFHGVTLAPD